ncbi:MAG: benzylsuccinate synthase gamma subunit family protein [Clostridia bacterium]|nr:benzylsuccinate synthase gamma subunit family protein [Clostridia bacterium]
MATCAQCRSFFLIPEDADDFEQGKGDCVRQEQDEKGKYWLSKPIMSHTLTDTCPHYKGKN